MDDYSSGGYMYDEEIDEDLMEWMGIEDKSHSMLRLCKRLVEVNGSQYPKGGNQGNWEHLSEVNEFAANLLSHGQNEDTEYIEACREVVERSLIELDRNTYEDKSKPIFADGRRAYYFYGAEFWGLGGVWMIFDKDGNIEHYHYDQD